VRASSAPLREREFRLLFAGRLTSQAGSAIAPIALAPNAVAPDGRILVEVVSRASWFWPSAILDPKTARLTIVPPGIAYDMTSAGWDAQGRVMTVVLGLEASLWRFRPEKQLGR